MLKVFCLYVHPSRDTGVRFKTHCNVLLDLASSRGIEQVARRELSLRHHADMRVAAWKMFSVYAVQCCSYIDLCDLYGYVAVVRRRVGSPVLKLIGLLST